MPGIVDGEHIHELKKLAPGRTRYTQRERFRGILVPFLKSMLRDTQKGFVLMGEALRQRAEATER
jgi:hypothetical protein